MSEILFILCEIKLLNFVYGGGRWDFFLNISLVSSDIVQLYSALLPVRTHKNCILKLLLLYLYYLLFQPLHLLFITH